jgi:hypothetical protein
MKQYRIIFTYWATGTDGNCLIDDWGIVNAQSREQAVAETARRKAKNADEEIFLRSCLTAKRVLFPRFIRRWKYE